MGMRGCMATCHVPGKKRLNRGSAMPPPSHPQDDQVCRFTSANHEWFAAAAGVCVTTYTMVAYSGRRSEESENVMNEIMNREWGLIILDEVHVVPAQMFRKVGKGGGCGRKGEGAGVGDCGPPVHAGEDCILLSCRT